MFQTEEKVERSHEFFIFKSIRMDTLASWSSLAVGFFIVCVLNDVQLVQVKKIRVLCQA